MRLSEGLLAQTDGEAEGHHALHALLLFQMSRQPARTNEAGELVTLEDQDRSLWDEDMIFDGVQQLSAAKASETLTRYHIEAGIASMHAEARDWRETNWQAVTRLYQLLYHQLPTLAVLINWAISLIMLGNIEDAKAKLAEAAAHPGAEQTPAYHLAQAKIAKLSGNHAQVQASLGAARACKVSAPVAAFIDQDENATLAG